VASGRLRLRADGSRAPEEAARLTAPAPYDGRAVGRIYEDFQRELAACRARYAGRPRGEMLRLFLVALEREEIVAVGYREGRIAARLARMPLDAEVRELIRHALLWAWKDEEMHAIYIRGALLRLGGLPLRARAFVTQAAGALGGWSTSVRQHARWGDAPLSRALATGLTWAGTLTGKVPKDVRAHLDYGPFRAFCLFNVDAEKTAWLCWSRLVELAEQVPGMPEELVPEFRRIERDESNHEHVFATLVAALDDEDRLAAGETAAGLAAKLGAVGEFFLPRALRKTTLAENPIGSGGKVFVAEAGAGEEKRALLRRLLDDAGLALSLAERAAALGKPVSAMKVAVKPTFMLGYNRKDRSPITDPALVEELALVLKELGCADVAVLEGRNIYDRFYANRAVRDVARYLGVESPHYRLVDASEEQLSHRYDRGMAQHTIARTWRDADFRISFGKVRGHPIEVALLAVGNLEWLGARCDEFLFAERQAERETAIMTLVGDFPSHFALLDAFEAVPDGLLGVMGCPRPKTPRRLYAGCDALAVDVVAGRHVGMKSPRDSPILRAACAWFGDPSSAIEVVGVDRPIEGWRGPYHDELSALLSFVAYPVYVFGSGRGVLFVPEMDEEAFPPLSPEGPLLRFSRGAIRALLGLRHPR
jgi:uncharacterized protein (DUF362 family)